jgi:hypothetical protein
MAKVLKVKIKWVALYLSFVFCLQIICWNYQTAFLYSITQLFCTVSHSLDSSDDIEMTFDIFLCPKYFL